LNEIKFIIKKSSPVMSRPAQQHQNRPVSS
jgi:hypothetical protein